MDIINASDFLNEYSNVSRMINQWKDKRSSKEVEKINLNNLKKGDVIDLSFRGGNNIQLGFEGKWKDKYYHGLQGGSLEQALNSWNLEINISHYLNVDLNLVKPTYLFYSLTGQLDENLPTSTPVIINSYNDLKVMNDVKLLIFSEKGELELKIDELSENITNDKTKFTKSLNWNQKDILSTITSNNIVWILFKIGTHLVFADIKRNVYFITTDTPIISLDEHIIMNGFYCRQDIILQIMELTWDIG